MPGQNVNILVNTLPEYIDQRRDSIIKKVVLEGKTLKRLVPQTGIKTKAKINYLGVDPTFQNGDGCGFNAQGSIELTQREIETGRIKVNMDLCPDTLLGKFAEHLVKIGATAEECPFEKFIEELLVNAIRNKLERALWQGDKTSNDDDLKYFDGFLKLANQENDTIKLSIASGTSVYDAIEAVIMALPDQITDRDSEGSEGNGVSIFVGSDIYKVFLREMVNKNFYHYAGPDAQAPTEFIFPGTNIPVVKTYGLTGTKKIYASYTDNMYYGCDLESNAEEVDIWFSKDDGVFKFKVRWNSGVQTAFPQFVVLASLENIPAVQSSVIRINKVNVDNVSLEGYHEVKALSADAAKGSVAGSGLYRDGAKAVLSATPAEGFVFEKWADDAEADAVREVVVNADATYTASFVAAPAPGPED